MQRHSAGPHDGITDVSGIRVGHASELIAKTGVTVILPSGPVCAGAYIGGSASSTRQMDSLKPNHVVERIHGICLCGGSAFGLDAAGGVMTYLEKQGIGIPITGHTIPIVPAAVIFDLNFGIGSIRPNAAMGFQACENASSAPADQGSVGAGTGATVGKLLGIEHAMKGGVGSASAVYGNLVVGALVVVNAYGDVTDTEGRILAGVRTSPSSLETADAALLLKEGKAVSRRVSVENTTLAVVAANARFDGIIAERIARQASLGLGKVIRPFHTHIDGDLTIVLSAGDQEADPSRIGLIAMEVLQKAAINAVSRADGFGILPSYSDTVADLPA